WAAATSITSNCSTPTCTTCATPRRHARSTWPMSTPPASSAIASECWCGCQKSWRSRGWRTWRHTNDFVSRLQLEIEGAAVGLDVHFQAACPEIAVLWRDGGGGSFRCPAGPKRIIGRWRRDGNAVAPDRQASAMLRLDLEATIRLQDSRGREPAI